MTYQLSVAPMYSDGSVAAPLTYEGPLPDLFRSLTVEAHKLSSGFYTEAGREHPDDDTEAIALDITLTFTDQSTREH